MFDSLKIDPTIKNDLRQALSDRFPQSVLISGPAGSGKGALAQMLSAALLCSADTIRPCGTCLSCRKVLDNIHPDCIVYDLSDSENRKVDAARRLRREASILPNDSDRKVFIITQAHTLNPAAQNALLKVLEEPPRYCFFLLLTSNPSALLETIRSRCTHYRLSPLQETPFNEALLTQFAPYLCALAEKNEFSLMRAAVPLEKLSRADLGELLGLLQTALRDAALYTVSGPLLPTLRKETAALAKAITQHKLIALYDLAGIIAARVEGNAGTAAVTCALTAECYSILFE